MSKWKKLTSIILFLSLLSSLFGVPAKAEPSPPSGTPPELSAQSAILLEGKCGYVIQEKAAHQRMPMASTTKIMTALVALDTADPTQIITVSPEAVGVEGSSIYLQAGEELTLEELLYALLLESANDAAVAIAIGIAGSVEAFAEQMNQKAAELGLKDTHFVNPHGLDHAEHYTTAYELALLTRYALQNQAFRTIVSTRKTTIPHASTNSARLLVNHNKMLRMYEDCIGVKTGFTKKSGRCLVSAAERDGVLLIAVTLNAPNDWSDHAALFDYGFTQYTSVELCLAEEFLFPVSVVGGAESYVMVGNAASAHAVLPSNHAPILTTVEAPRFLYAGIESGEVLGRVVFKCDIEGNGNPVCIGSVDLTARYGIEQKAKKKSFWQWLLELFGID